MINYSPMMTKCTYCHSVQHVMWPSCIRCNSMMLGPLFDCYDYALWVRPWDEAVR